MGPRKGLLARILGRGGPQPENLAATPISVVLYSKRVCPLCDDVKRELERVQSPLAWTLEVVPIDGDAELEERHGLSVPVLSIAGRPAFKGRFTAEEFARKLVRRAEERG